MIPITVPEYKQLISKARKLKSQIDNNNLNKDLVKNFVDFTLNTAPENFDTKTLTKDDIAKMFKNYLMTELDYIYKKGKYEHYWDYREDVSSSDLEEILKLANTEKTDDFKQAATYYIWQEYPEIESEDIDYIIKDFYEKNSEKVDEIKDGYETG